MGAFSEGTRNYVLERRSRWGTLKHIYIIPSFNIHENSVGQFYVKLLFMQKWEVEHLQTVVQTENVLQVNWSENHHELSENKFRIFVTFNNSELNFSFHPNSNDKWHITGQRDLINSLW